MKRRIWVNMLLAFIVLPLIVLIKDYIRMEIFDDHSGYTGTFWRYLEISFSEIFILIPFMFLFSVLLPYNIIVVFFFMRKRALNFFLKYCIFLTITALIIFVLSGSGLQAYPDAYDYLNIFIALCLSSFLFAFLIHYLVDRKYNNTK